MHPDQTDCPTRHATPAVFDYITEVIVGACARHHQLSIFLRGHDMSSSADTSVLFVCMGNICRSPTAHAVFDRLVAEAGLNERIRIDSAGTHAYHVGNPPDQRAAQAAILRQYRMDHLTARQVEPSDIEQFDYVLAMDRANLEILRSLAGDALRDKPRLFMSYAADYGLEEVPDPYYGGDRGFEQVLDMVEAAAGNLLDDIRASRLG